MPTFSNSADAKFETATRPFSQITFEGVKPENNQINVAVENSAELFKIPLKMELGVGESFAGAFAIRTDSEEPEKFGIQFDFTDFSRYFSLPEGTYTFVLAGTQNKEKVIPVIIVKQDVTVNADVPENVTFNIADADKVITTKWVNRTGETLTYPSAQNATDGNCSMGISYIYYYYDDQNLGAFQLTSSPGSVADEILYGGDPGHVSALRMDMIAGYDGCYLIKLPIDFTTTIVSNTTTNWVSGEVEIAETPHNKPLNDWLASKNIYNFRYYRTGILLDGEFPATSSHFTGFGNPGFDYPCNKIHFWEPEDMQISAEFVATLYGAIFNGPEPTISSPPIVRRGDKLVCLGLNNAFNNSSDAGRVLWYKSNPETGKIIKNLSGANPYFTYDLNGTSLGNCVPMLVTIPMYPVIQYDYVGRNGEDMSIDSFNLMGGLIKINPEDAGGQTSNIKVWYNDELMCESLTEFPDIEWNWDDVGTYKYEIYTDNVLVDGEIPGYNKATLEYDMTKGNQTSPTMTSLRFKTTNGDVTDRFATPDEGIIQLTVADFDMGETLETSPISSVKVFYAPYGTDNWETLEVEEIPELFFMPGYGYFYQGELSSIKQPSDNCWYDLKVQIKDEDNAYQEQMLSPAFRIEKTGSDGLQTTEITSSNLNKIEVWTPEGKLLKQCTDTQNLKYLPRGLYIIRNGNKVTKICN